MQKEYNKQFTYKNYTFNISVNLYHKVERRPNGKVLHFCVINDMGVSNFYKSDYVSSEELLDRIAKLEKDAIEYVDNLENSQLSNEEISLLNIGFSDVKKSYRVL